MKLIIDISEYNIRYLAELSMMPEYERMPTEDIIAYAIANEYARKIREAENYQSKVEQSGGDK